MPSITPIVERDRKITRWGIADIYNGTSTGGQYVPNPDDEVWSWSEGLFRVVSVDYETCLCVLEKQSDKNLSSGLRTEDVLLSSRPGTPATNFRVYVNTSVTPHVMNFDNFLCVYGSSAAYLKLFRGRDISSKGDVISAQFNSSGIMQSENILFETVQDPERSIIAIKTPVSGFVTDTLSEGEIVTAVVYSASGEELSVSQLVTVITNTVRNIDASRKQITDISLISPFLSQTDNLLLEIPVNLTIDSIPLQLKVTYSDGSSATRPIGDDRAALNGMANYVASEMGYTADLVLTYTLTKGEYSNLVKTVDNRSFITKPYRLRTIDSDNAYEVKLFVIPYWNFTKNEWALQYYLYTLDRNVIYNVTELVEYSVNSTPFNGRLFNRAQSLNVAVNLSKVHSSYNYYRHTATFNITLVQAATNIGSTGYYLLEYNNNSIVGARTIAKVNEAGNQFNIDLSQGLLSGGAVLDSLYWSTEPIYYQYAEASAPAPTHVRIKIGANWQRIINVDELNTVLRNVDAPANDVRQGALVRLEFYRQTQAGVLELGTTALTVVR